MHLLLLEIHSLFFRRLAERSRCMPQLHGFRSIHDKKQAVKRYMSVQETRAAGVGGIWLSMPEH